MTIQNLSTQETAERTAAYMKRTTAQLRDLAHTMGLETTGTKAQIIARIMGQSAKAEVKKPAFDWTGVKFEIFEH